MPVDSFKYLPRLITRYYKLTRVKPELPIPWTPLARPLDQCRFGLVTSGGLYHKGHEPPFDVERERREPAWGDPSFRTMPITADMGRYIGQFLRGLRRGGKKTPHTESTNTCNPPITREGKQWLKK